MKYLVITLYINLNILKETGLALIKRILFHYFSIEWTGILKIEQGNVKYSLEDFLNRTNSTLNCHVSL